MKKKKKATTAVLILILIAGVSLTASMYLMRGKDKDTVSEDVSVSSVDICQTITAAGEIVTADEKTIRFSTSKVFRAMCVEENEEVKKGQHLIMYSDGTYEDAPADGFITEIYAPLSGTAADSSYYVTFAYEKKLRLDITVPESEINDIRKGDSAEITVGSDGDMTYTGKIVSMKAVSTTQLEDSGSSKESIPGGTEEGQSPFGSDSSTAYYTVSLSVKNDGKLLPGMSAVCTVVKTEKKEVTAVPVEAVGFDSDGKAYVVTVTGKETEKTYVETGISDAEYVEITDGLSAGDTVRIERKEKD